MRSSDVDWAGVVSAVGELGTADADVATVGSVLVTSCHRALGATASAVWFGTPGGADWQLVASHGRVPNAAELPAPWRRRGSLRCSRDAHGSPICTTASAALDGQVVVTFWVRFAPHEYLGPQRVGALDLLIAVGTGALRRSQSSEHARKAGVLLQRRLLPEVQPGDSGEAATRYAPAGDGSQVGGDWYDIVHTHDQRTVLVLGDVAGHGIEAAVQMTQFRTVLHSHLLEGLPATIALARLNDLALDRDGFATCCCIEMGPQGTVVTSAGHPPPIVVGPNNHAALCTIQPGPPLGAIPHATYPAQRSDLQPGDTVVLYSDGLVERPGTIVTDEIERLRRAAANAVTNDPSELADHLVGLAGPLPRLRDDVAVLAFRPVLGVLDPTTRSGPASVPIGQLPLSDDLIWQLIEATPDALIVTDTVGTIVLANQRIETLFGYSRSELIGTPIDRLVPEDLRTRHAEHRQRYLEEPTIRPMSNRELHGRHRDGTTIVAEVTLSPVHVDHHTYVIATIRPRTPGASPTRSTSAP
ncbi:SpoIIE family protein phosphatase [Rhabdothermincola salaria]|uniref:SpoIIE family protein phosphatase n=1 Tax=Rhabdothermincola salaria TaxID=2903142 RepID=UPI001E64A77A|nr:SpoIIE family protein phosphatase [Rhabdothermincola salaria]MCD9622523.1 SpoIIE family protein phosphatase [Rhabdothermincola salaria]